MFEKDYEVIAIIGRHGRLTIPAKVREELQMKEGDAVKITVTEKGFEVKKIGG